MKRRVTYSVFVVALTMSQLFSWIGGANAYAEEVDDEQLSESHDVVVVTGARQEERKSESAIKTDVIDAQTIEDSGAETMAELLEHHPGIEIFRSFRGSAVRIHGMDPKYVLILVDGRRQVGDLGGAIDLERYPLDRVERVEIVKGASSALYGSRALGGVINIITRKPSSGVQADFHLASDWGAAEIAHWGDGHAPANIDATTRLEVTRENWSNEISAGWHQGQAIRYEPDSFATTFPDFKEFAVADKASWNISDATTLRAGIDYLRRDHIGREESAPKQTPFGEVTDRFDIKTTTENASVWVAHDVLEPKSYSLKSEAHFLHYRDQYLSNQQGSTEDDSYNESKETIVEVRSQYGLQSIDDHSLVLGVEAVAHELKSDRLEVGYLNRYTGSLYGQDTWTLVGEKGKAGALDLVPAIRGDFDSQYGVHPSPKLAIRYEPVEGFIVRTSFGSGFVAPRFKELGFLFENLNVGYKVLGNPDLEPETSWDGDFNIEYRPARWMTLNAAVYRSNLRNQISTVQCIDDGAAQPAACSSDLALSATGPVYAYKNLDRSRFMAAELGVGMWLGWFAKVNLSYALTDARENVKEDGGEDNWVLLSGRAIHRVNTDLKFSFRPWGVRASMRGSWVGKQPTSRFDESGERVWADSYLNLDARLSKALGDHLDLFAGIENINNVYDPVDLVVRPRTALVGLNARM